MELLSRRRARQALIPFTDYTNEEYEAARHHHLIADRLEAIERGDLHRLIIRMPPRHGKSELASRRFPAWYLGRNPNRQIIAASYNSDLATDFGRDVRNIVASPEYAAVFPQVTLRQDSKAADRWNTNKGGVYVAAGVGTATTGRGAHLGIIDDPIKDRQEADSETIRDRIWAWYQSTFRTRLMPGGAIVLIQTSWHEDDLAGRILDSAGASEWEDLKLPALKDGKALWPEWYDVPELERIRRDIGGREWSALYQQEPSPDEGTFFKREWFGFYDDPPKHLEKYGASDWATTADGGDYTVHGVIGVDPNDDLYILDWWREQAETDKSVDALCDMILAHKPLYWADENIQITKGIGPFLQKRMRERKAYCAREVFSVSRGSQEWSKAMRCRSFQGRAAMGKVYLPRHAPWTETLLAELLRFPASTYDDQADVLGLIGRLLDKMVGGSEPKPEGPKPDRWDRAFKSTGTAKESWKTV